MKIDKFTNGIVVIDSENTYNDNGNINIIHFVGYWEKPSIEDYISLHKELKTDPKHGLIDISDRLIILPITQEILDHFNLEVDKINEDNMREDSYDEGNIGCDMENNQKSFSR